MTFTLLPDRRGLALKGLQHFWSDTMLRTCWIRVPNFDSNVPQLAKLSGFGLKISIPEDESCFVIEQKSETISRASKSLVR